MIIIVIIIIIIMIIIIKTGRNVWLVYEIGIVRNLSSYWFMAVILV